jgi:hypothetical protein
LNIDYINGPSIGADGVDDGSDPDAAVREPGPSLETTDDTTAVADDAATGPEPDPVPVTTDNPTRDIIDDIAGTVAVDTSTDAENGLDLLVSSNDADIVANEGTLTDEEVDDIASLTDPETWRNILNRGFRENRCLVQIWRGVVAPIMGISFPFDPILLKRSDREELALRLRAFGVAFKTYCELRNDGHMRSIIRMLIDCDRENIVVVNIIEEYLGLSN